MNKVNNAKFIYRNIKIKIIFLDFRMMISNLVEEMALIGKFELNNTKNNTQPEFINFLNTNITYIIVSAAVFISIIILTGAIFLYCKFCNSYLQLSDRSSSNQTDSPQNPDEPEMSNLPPQNLDDPDMPRLPLPTSKQMTNFAQQNPVLTANPPPQNFEEIEMTDVSLQKINIVQEESSNLNEKTGTRKKVSYYSDSQKSALMTEAHDRIVDQNKKKASTKKNFLSLTQNDKPSQKTK